LLQHLQTCQQAAIQHWFFGLCWKLVNSLAWQWYEGDSPMTLNFRSALSGWFLAAGFSLILTSAAFAQELGDLEGECRNEAEYYGIPPEQRDEYVAGCVLSRGGAPAMPAMEEQAIDEQMAEDQLREDQLLEQQTLEEQQLQEPLEHEELAAEQPESGAIEPQSSDR
jgi:hypothetical protein